MTFALAKRCMKAAGTFPARDAFELAAQIRRSALSVPSNIAEGFGRGSSKDYVRFLKIARGSLFELDTQVSMAKELGYLTSRAYSSLMADWTEASKVLAGLIRRLESTAKTSRSANAESRITNADSTRVSEARGKDA